VQRTAQLSLRTLAIALLGFAQRVGIDRYYGVELFVVERDPLQVLLHQLARRDIPARHRPLHVRDARLDDVEFGLRCSTRHRKQQHDQQSLHHRPSLKNVLRPAGHVVAPLGAVLPSRFSQK
jgi:hypothetical protein